MGEQALVALGSNLGDRAATMARAAEGLSGAGRVLARSRLYETPPMGPAQPDYLNAVVLLETDLAPRSLLDHLLAVERSLGRVRGERWGPRTIDLDLLAHGSAVVDEPGLVLPHPGLAERAFVLAPLCDISPQWRFPDGRTARGLLDALDPSLRAGVRALADEWPRVD